MVHRMVIVHIHHFMGMITHIGVAITIRLQDVKYLQTSIFFILRCKTMIFLLLCFTNWMYAGNLEMVKFQLSKR